MHEDNCICFSLYCFIYIQNEVMKKQQNQYIMTYQEICLCRLEMIFLSEGEKVSYLSCLPKILSLTGNNFTKFLTCTRRTIRV